MIRQRTSAAQNPSRTRRIVRWVAVTGFSAGVVVLAQALIVKPYRIPSSSMAPALRVGDRVLVDRVRFRLTDPHIGEIVVFHPPTAARLPGCGKPSPVGSPCVVAASREDRSTTFVKRIVAGPGDRLTIRRGRTFTNGRRVGPRTAGCTTERGCTYARSLRVPAGRWYLMGDNRSDSNDSRFWGAVPTGWLIGPVVADIWPPARWTE